MPDPVRIELALQDAAYDAAIYDHMTGSMGDSRHPTYKAMRHKLETARRMATARLQEGYGDDNE